MHFYSKWQSEHPAGDKGEEHSLLPQCLHIWLRTTISMIKRRKRDQHSLASLPWSMRRQKSKRVNKSLGGRLAIWPRLHCRVWQDPFRLWLEMDQNKNKNQSFNLVGTAAVALYEDKELKRWSSIAWKVKNINMAELCSSTMQHSIFALGSLCLSFVSEHALSYGTVATQFP